MPLPFIVGAVVTATTAATGVGGHVKGKKTNEEAQRIVKEAENNYNKRKDSLEKTQKKTENALCTFGHIKKDVLEGSVMQFFDAYSKIKSIEFVESEGLDEISKLTLDKQEMLQLEQMANVYKGVFAQSAAGAVTGVMISLATSGTLPLVTSLMSCAGPFAAGGQIGLAAGSVMSAVQFGLSFTPLTAVAAPVVLFTGISSALKANENLEKARSMRAEANKAIEEMKVIETKCAAIGERTEMFSKLLKELNGMFSMCTEMLENMIQKKVDENDGMVDARTFTKEEINLIAVTRALAGAVKTIIDTPIMDKDGGLLISAYAVYLKSKEQTAVLQKAVNEVHTTLRGE